MKKWIIGLMLALIVTSGMAFTVSTQVMAEKPIYELYAAEYSEPFLGSIPNDYQVFAPVKIGFLEDVTTQLTSIKGGVAWVNESTLKVPIYSVSLPDENKIVLVKDPKGFHEQALKHKMEYIAIKPTLKSEYWEFVPVFSVEKSVTFNPKTTVEKASDEDMDLLRIVPVADFIRYN